MVKVFGVVFIALLVAAPVAVADYFVGSGFLLKFVREQSSGIIGTILALNVATVTYLVSHLLSIEKEAGNPLFSRTKQEIKENIYFMAGILPVNLLILSLIPNLDSKAGLIIGLWSTGASYLSLVLLILTIFALLEIVKAIFRISDFISEGK